MLRISRQSKTKIVLVENKNEIVEERMLKEEIKEIEEVKQDSIKSDSSSSFESSSES